MSNGKKLEKFVRLIQESLKNVPETKVFSNYKIPNKSGRKRELDVLIKSSVNNIEILIAIECKDYKTAIPVEKIEAFKSKCDRIKGISKKIFVAANGYQADAYEAANDFDIDLYNLDEICESEIVKWFPIVQLRGQYRIKLPVGVGLSTINGNISNLPTEDDLVVSYYKNDKKIPLTHYIWNTVVFEHQRALKSVLVYDFMKNGNNLNYQTMFPFEGNVTDIYVMDDENNKLKINKLKGVIIGWLEEHPANILEGRNFNRSDNQTEANVISIDVEQNEIADIVFTKNNPPRVFHTDSEGLVHSFKTLCKYDPKTDEFEYPSEGE